jgi:hypothetical protein
MLRWLYRLSSRMKSTALKTRSPMICSSGGVSPPSLSRFKKPQCSQPPRQSSRTRRPLSSYDRCPSARSPPPGELPRPELMLSLLTPLHPSPLLPSAPAPAARSKVLFCILTPRSTCPLFLHCSLATRIFFCNSRARVQPPRKTKQTTATRSPTLPYSFSLHTLHTPYTFARLATVQGSTLQFLQESFYKKVCFTTSQRLKAATLISGNAHHCLVEGGTRDGMTLPQGPGRGGLSTDWWLL